MFNTVMDALLIKSENGNKGLKASEIKIFYIKVKNKYW